MIVVDVSSDPDLPNNPSSSGFVEVRVETTPDGDCVVHYEGEYNNCERWDSLHSS